MRKITWLILLFIIITWLAISTYWTGNGSSKKLPQENQITSTPTPEPSLNNLDIPLSPSASPSSTLTASPSASPSLEPTITSRLKF